MALTANESIYIQLCNFKSNLTVMINKLKTSKQSIIKKADVFIQSHNMLKVKFWYYHMAAMMIQKSLGF